ncbi:MAG: Sec-independent protein translocase protein TatB [Betaproteobacteria bacterium]
MAVTALVALVVLGPERLPRVARQVGQWLGKLQRYVSDVKSDINRQMELEDLRKLQTEVTTAAREVESSVKSAVDGAQSQFDALSSAFESDSKPAEPVTDWDRIYAVRRSRDRIRDRRIERDRELRRKRPKRRFHRS